MKREMVEARFEEYKKSMQLPEIRAEYNATYGGWRIVDQNEQIITNDGPRWTHTDFYRFLTTSIEVNRYRENYHKILEKVAM